MAQQFLVRLASGSMFVIEADKILLSNAARMVTLVDENNVTVAMFPAEHVAAVVDQAANKTPSK